MKDEYVSEISKIYVRLFIVQNEPSKSSYLYEGIYLASGNH